MLESLNSVPNSQGEAAGAETLDDKLFREANLIAVGVSGFKAAAEDSIINHPVETATQVITSAAVGMALGLATRGAFMGTTMALAANFTIAKDLLPKARELGSAFVDNFQSSAHWDHNVAVVKKDLGKSAFDFTLMAATGVASGFIGQRYLAAPLLDYADVQLSSPIAGKNVIQDKLAGLIKEHVAEPTTIVPVTPANVDAASQAALEGFGYAKGILRPDLDFKASVNPELASSHFGNDAHAPSSVKYFVSLDRHGEITGTTGLYKTADDSQADWLGWLSVRPNARGRGLGQQLLNFSVAQARKDGVPYLKLYTSDHPGEAVAQQLYEKNGFHLTGIDPPNQYGVRIMYRERPLASPLEEKVRQLGGSLRNLFRSDSSTAKIAGDPLAGKEIPSQPQGASDRVNSSGNDTWQGKDGATYKFGTPDVKENTSWHPIYESNFPDNERQPYEFLESLAAPGAVPHVKLQTTERAGQTVAFSVTSDYGEGTEGRKLLMPYIGVDQRLQSGGIGGQHLERTLASLKEQYPTAKGMILEMEPVEPAPGITPEVLEQRQKRVRFWTRNGAQVLDDVDYRIPSSEAGEPPLPMKLLWVDFNKGGLTQTHLKELVESIYNHGYELPSDDPMVKGVLSQFERHPVKLPTAE